MPIFPSAYPRIQRYAGGMKDTSKTPEQRQQEAIARVKPQFRDRYLPKPGKRTNVGDPNHKR